MKIRMIFLVLLVAPFISLAQIGVNTTTPKATLDVVGKPTTTTEMDGILPPRLTGDQLQAKTYGTDQNGALVFVTQAASSPSGQTVNVRASGLYMFNATLNRWTAISSFQFLRNVYCNNNNPNSATVFDDVLPVVAHDASLIQNAQFTYFGLDGSTWIWNGSTYIAYTPNYSLEVGQRISIFRTYANSIASNTVLTASDLIELDGLVRIDSRKVDNNFYSPRILNISGSSLSISYQTFATTTLQNETSVSTTVANGSAIEVDLDNLVYWITGGFAEIITVNMILPNGKWYEVQWYAFEESSSKRVFMTVLRKF